MKKRAFRIGAALLLGSLPAFAQIDVGPNVQVSKAREHAAHDEVLIAADPEDADHLMACSLEFPSDRSRERTVAYVSADRGKTWKPAVDTSEFPSGGDPACAFGRHGAAYLASIVTRSDDKYLLAVYRSADRGKTWQGPFQPPQGNVLDREYLTVDNVSEKYAGRVYMHGTRGTRSLDGEKFSTGIDLLHSQDGGATFSGPVGRSSFGRNYVLGMGNSAVLSDGTVIHVFGELKTYWDDAGKQGVVEESQPDRSNAVLKSLRSTDGGETLENAVSIGDFYLRWPPDSTSAVPTVAVDPGSRPFKDRLYVVWPDGRSGRQEILLASSTDQGKTWSRPIVVNDDHPKGSLRPDHLMPTVAVNRDGVVGVAWYDRRDNPDNLGWWVRFAASFDGGETFTPSVRVSEAPTVFGGGERWPLMIGSSGGGAGEAKGGPLHVTFAVNGFFYNGGHTGGLTADAAGSFHPLWVDNRTGLPQVWTASVSAKGEVSKNGSPELAQLDDVSENVVFELSEVSYDRAKQLLSATVRLKNTSKDTVRGPVRARVIALSSELGRPEVVNADNKQPAGGAVFDFGDLLPQGTLKPGEVSGSRRLEFRVSEPRSFRQGKEFKFGLLALDARVLGKLEKKENEKEKERESR